MDGQVGKLGANGGDQHRRRARLQQTSHVLHGEHINTVLNELGREVDIIVQRIFSLLRIAHVTSVANCRFNDAVGVAHGVDAKHEVIFVVERVKNAENIDTRLARLVHEALHDVVRVRSITDRVGAAKKHLKWDVWHLLTKKLESPPRILLQESKRDVEGGATPHLKRIRATEGASREWCRTTKVVRPHARRQERLVRVPPRRIHDEQALVLANRFGERRRTLLVQNSLEPGVLELR
mmetsp:Transcript_5186/g.20130  ORF Transcript_5186/g.20130 Transcript_5186/m.20130 type:complete len:237 (-) Transcript_5186:1805-2515(-)